MPIDRPPSPTDSTQYQAESLEIHVVDHCNLTCRDCSHESPRAKRRLADPATTVASVESLARFYSTPLVKLLGGEPLLHPDLRAIIEGVKEVSGARVRVVTNGTLLSRWPERAASADEVHISVYPTSKVPTREEAQDLCDRFGFTVTFQRFDQFRLHRRHPSNDANLTSEIFSTCQMYGAWNCHTIWEDKLFPCPPAATWGSDHASLLLLPQESLTQAQVVELLTSPEPFDTCAQCLGSVGRLVPHELSSRQSIPAIGVVDDIDHEFLQSLRQQPRGWNGCYEYTETIRPSRCG